MNGTATVTGYSEDYGIFGAVRNTFAKGLSASEARVKIAEIGANMARGGMEVCWVGSDVFTFREIETGSTGEVRVNLS